ncbi:hypothetical protein NJH77_24220 [Serratia fonticola]|uniref:hypothetical protein n=1 Tax=Serratia fonticola TaxID=47917 RepID=UPI0020985E62|nr:hypothetical protein [Serratia fonticola]MCO7512358.1 hypothetical protein [Serratia fonticola]
MTRSTVTTERLREIIERRSPSLRWGEAEKVAAELLAVREAQPVVEVKPYGYLRENNGQVQISIGPERPADRSGGYATPWGAIYAAPPAPAVPAVPDAITADNAPAIFEIAAQIERIGLSGAYGAYASGWNACRAAMLQPVSHGYTLPDDNEALCHLAESHGASIAWGFEEGEYQHILTFYPYQLRAMVSDVTGGKPVTGNSPVIPDGWKLVPNEPTTKQWAAGYKAMEGGIDKVTLAYKAMVDVAPTPAQAISNE